MTRWRGAAWAAVLIAACLCAQAEIEIPGKCYSLQELDQAMKAAEENGKLLMVIRVNLRTVRKSEEEAFEQYYKGFRSYAEIVVMDKKKDVLRLPIGLRDGFLNLEGGYPRAVAIDPDKPDVFVEMVPYLPISDREERMKLYKNRIAKYKRDKYAEEHRIKPPGPRPPEDPEPAPEPDPDKP